MAKYTSAQKTALNRAMKANQDVSLGTQLENVYPMETAQLLVADGAITVKQGVCTIAKTVAGVVAATLADPTDVTDDYKRLVIINGQAQANTVTSASSFGGGGAGKDVATFGAAIGNTLELMAFGGKWYVLGNYGVTLA